MVRASSLLLVSAKSQSKPLGLAYFIETSKSRQLWRFIVRTAYRIPDNSRRKELVQWARHEFDANRNETDVEKIKYLVSMGTKEANNMAKYLRLQ